MLVLVVIWGGGGMGVSALAPLEYSVTPISTSHAPHTTTRAAYTELHGGLMQLLFVIVVRETKRYLQMSERKPWLVVISEAERDHVLRAAQSTGSPRCAAHALCEAAGKRQRV